jgi:hypothetical protein
MSTVQFVRKHEVIEERAVAFPYYSKNTYLNGRADWTEHYCKILPGEYEGTILVYSVVVRTSSGPNAHYALELDRAPLADSAHLFGAAPEARGINYEASSRDEFEAMLDRGLDALKLFRSAALLRSTGAAAG